MKKHIFMYLLAAFTFGSVVTSCSDDDDTISCPVTSSTYEQADLALTYSGQPMVGKKVVFIPEGNKATLTLSGSSFAIDGALLNSNQNIELFPSTCGVIPGEITTTLNVDLKFDGNKAVFEGTDELNGRTLVYKGVATDTKLNLDLQVTMPKNELTGKTLYCYKNKKGNSDYDPLIVEWDIKDETFGHKNAVDLFSSFMKLPLIDKKYSVSDFLYSVFKSVTFMEDGNIKAAYKDAMTDKDFKESPLNVATYQFIEPGKIKLFLNPNMIDYIVNQSRAAAEEPNTEELLANLGKLVGLVSQKLQNGIEVNYALNEKGFMEVYLNDEAVTKPIFEILFPILNEPIVNAVLEKLVKDNLPEGLLFGGFLPITPEFAWSMLNNFLIATPEYLKNTNYIKLGMVFSEEPAVEK